MSAKRRTALFLTGFWQLLKPDVPPLNPDKETIVLGFFCSCPSIAKFHIVFISSLNLHTINDCPYLILDSKSGH